MKQVKDCGSCSSYLSDAEKVKDLLNGRLLNAPICARFGHVLGREGLSTEEESSLLQYYADECPHHGEPAPSVPESMVLRIASPDASIMSSGGNPGALHSCHGCANLIKDEAVMDTFGWTLPVCRAKGTLVFQPTREAKECPWAAPGMPQSSVGGLPVLDQYLEGFSFTSIKALQAMLNNGNVNVEPNTYPTDAPVSDEEKADGIRAWRRIMSPYGDDKEIMLPIFDRTFFSEHEQEIIPKTGDSHHPELYIDYSNMLWKFAAKAWGKDETILLTSEPGLGKTEFTYWAAWLMQVPWRRVVVGPGTEPDDLYGKILAEAGTTYWQDGRYTLAYKAHAGILCLDEPNTGRDEILIPLRSTTDSNKQLVLEAGIAGLENDLIVKRGKYTLQIWCVNPSWDFRNLGTRELSAADMSRLMPSKLAFPPEALERKMIKERCLAEDDYEIPDSILDDMMKVAKDIREASKQGEFPGTWGIREQIQVARLTEYFPFVEAYREGKLNFFEPDTAEHVIDVCIKLYNSDDV